MSFFCLKQSRHACKDYEPVDQQDKTTESPTSRLICKVAVGENTEAANQQKPSGCCCCYLNTSSSNPTKTTAAAKEVELEDGLPRFGPCYGDDTESIKTAKEEAWDHFLSKSPKQQSTRPGNILLGIKDIYTQARGSYTPAVLNRVKKSQFQSMMMIDGCFFLQLALYILGDGELLGYPEKHVYFGKEKNGKNISQWIKAMFFVGNQIPCVVLRKLMKQNFFQEVLAKGIANKTLVNPPSEDLWRRALYLLVVSPEIKKIPGGKSSSSFHFYPFKKPAPYIRDDDPSDLLHALHCLVLGPEGDPTDCHEPEDVYDLEAGGAEEQDIDKNKVRFPSASELKQLGIKLRKADSGIRGIRFSKEWVVRAYLYIPPFTFDCNTELMLGYLKSYEIGQQLSKNKREVAPYLRLMRDLIRTEKDVKILEDRNILKVKKRDHRDRLPGFLNRLVSSDQEMGFTQNLRLTRLQVVDYSAPPWHLFSLAVIFTVVQTVFTILGYFLPRH